MFFYRFWFHPSIGNDKLFSFRTRVLSFQGVGFTLLGFRVCDLECRIGFVVCADLGLRFP